MSVPSPANTGARHAASSFAASDIAACNATGLPSIQAWPMSGPLTTRPVRPARRSLVILNISKALVRLRRAFERSSFLGRLPVDDVLDLLRQLEVLVGDPSGRMVLQTHLHPCIRCGDIRMMPGGLGQVADRIDHHQSSLPTMGAILAPDPAAFQIPMRQFTLESLFDLFIRVGAIVAAFGHGVPPSI